METELREKKRNREVDRSRETKGEGERKGELLRWKRQKEIGRMISRSK